MNVWNSKNVAIFQIWIYLGHEEIVVPISVGSTQEESVLLTNTIQRGDAL
jgi:hypothetical protein